jgi:putative transposase
MAPDQCALIEVLDALKVADVGDRVRQVAGTIYQALIEAETDQPAQRPPHPNPPPPAAARTLRGPAGQRLSGPAPAANSPSSQCRRWTHTR